MKVFGIGLNKTGTTTLRDCLQVLGYRVKGFDRRLTYQTFGDDLEPLFAVCEGYDGFQDFPWPLVYRELDRRYPGSKFVLTTRSNSSAWFESLKKHAYHGGPRRHRRLIYRYEMPHHHRQRYTAYYEGHNANVPRYFRDRPDDLLEICWESGSGWADICRFLDHPIPETLVPHSNRRGANRSSTWQQLRTNCRTGLSLLLDR